jgi:hypothetical protein
VENNRDAATALSHEQIEMLSREEVTIRQALVLAAIGSGGHLTPEQTEEFKKLMKRLHSIHGLPFRT